MSYLKRKVASRKLLRKCDYCNCSFKKGSVYYVKRHVVVDDKVYGYDVTTCARCKYENEESGVRFERFQNTCTHPHQFVYMDYSQMFGESILEPSHEECALCRQVV